MINIISHIMFIFSNFFKDKEKKWYDRNKIKIEHSAPSVAK